MNSCRSKRNGAGFLGEKTPGGSRVESILWERLFRIIREFFKTGSVPTEWVELQSPGSGVDAFIGEDGGASYSFLTFPF